jgi:hypothetical protein
MSDESWVVFEDLMSEASRVRDQVMPGYLALGAPGAYAVRNMRRQLDSAMRVLLRRDRVQARVLATALRAQKPPT